MKKLNVRIQKTWPGALYGLIYVFMYGVALSGFIVPHLPSLNDGKYTDRFIVLASVGGLTAMYVLYRAVQSGISKRALARRDRQLAQGAVGMGMVSGKGMRQSLSHTLVALAEKSASSVSNIYVSSTWQFFDYQYDVYKKTKHGQYVAAHVMFSVASFELPRSLPNVFFDSHYSGKKEFRRYFDDAQRHSLEGNFDDYFDTYFGEDYRIDSLSFISPEVMQAMIGASHYDIEIFDNKLYLISELEEMPRQLEDMYAEGEEVRKTLLNNILTYRDERIPYAQGRKTVSVKGLFLKRSLFKERVRVAAGVLLVVAGLAASQLGYPFGVTLSIVGLVASSSSAIELWKGGRPL